MVYKRYGGGEIGGEEIYSIYGLDFDTANGGDIVYQHIIGQSIGIIAENKVVVSETDYGEIYFFNYLYHSDAECPVYLRPRQATRFCTRKISLNSSASGSRRIFQSDLRPIGLAKVTGNYSRKPDFRRYRDLILLDRS